MSNAKDRRVSASMAYLDSATRGRANLDILCEAQVTGLVLKGGVAKGVRAMRPGMRPGMRAGAGDTVMAGEVIVSAGALHSPAILMRAGIGPATELGDHSIEVRADLPGVGRNLCEHPAVSMSAYLAARARLGRRMRRHLHVSLRYSSGLEGCPGGDMYMSAVAKLAGHPLGWRLGSRRPIGAPNRGSNSIFSPTCRDLVQLHGGDAIPL